MRSIIKAGFVSAAAAGMIATGGLTAGASAQPIAVGNLVTVQINNVLNNNDVVVSVPVNAAANICGVDVEVLLLAETTGDYSNVDCDADANQQVWIIQE